jgi:hypothetical protein
MSTSNGLQVSTSVNTSIAPLVAAVYQGQIEVVRLLLDLGAEVHVEVPIIGLILSVVEMAHVKRRRRD